MKRLPAKLILRCLPFKYEQVESPAWDADILSYGVQKCYGNSYVLIAQTAFTMSEIYREAKETGQSPSLTHALMKERFLEKHVPAWYRRLLLWSAGR